MHAVHPTNKLARSERCHMGMCRTWPECSHFILSLLWTTQSILGRHHLAYCACFLLRGAWVRLNKVQGICQLTSKRTLSDTIVSTPYPQQAGWPLQQAPLLRRVPGWAPSCGNRNSAKRNDPSASSATQWRPWWAAGRWKRCQSWPTFVALFVASLTQHLRPVGSHSHSASWTFCTAVTRFVNKSTN